MSSFVVPVRLRQDVDNDAQLMWNAHEAWLFVGTIHLGVTTTYGMLPYKALSAADPDDKVSEMFVTSRTTIGIRSRTIHDTRAEPYIVFNDSIYNARGDRWNGDTFERSGDVELRTFYAAMRGYDVYSPNNGWSYRRLFGGPLGSSKITMRIDDIPIDVIVTKADGYRRIEVSEPTRPLRELWSLNEHIRRVDREEYESVFGK